MTVKSVTFQGTTYVQDVVLGRPLASVALTLRTGPELVELYNLVNSSLGRGRVRRFENHTKAVARTWASLLDYDAASAEELASIEDALDEELCTIGHLNEETGEAEVDPGQVVSAPEQLAMSEQLIEVAAAAGSRAQARAALRTSPPASDNPAKDAEMPTLRKAAKVMMMEPKTRVFPRKAGSKQAVLVDLLSRPEGATFGELYDALAATGKPWRGVTIRSGLAWDINHIAGYGVQSELLNGEEFAAQDRRYEAKRLGMLYDGTVLDEENNPQEQWTPGPGYDPELKLAVYRLAYPAGMTAPLPHIEKKA